MQPEGWPGHIWLEGRTSVHLRNHQLRPSHMPRGPAKRTGPGFLNPAMAPARTRSVMLLADALEHDWLVKPGHDLRALDALCGTHAEPSRPPDRPRPLAVSALGFRSCTHQVGDQAAP
mgnify:CR=1 FL=1